MNTLWSAAPARRLAMLRIVIGLFPLYTFIRSFWHYVHIASAPPNMFKPIGVTTWLSGALPVQVFIGILLFCILLNLLFVLGWRIRIVAPLFAATLLFVLTYRTSWVQIYHADNLLVWQVIALAMSPALADAWSLDARAGRVEEREGWEYAWPIGLVCSVTVIGYFLAGAAKVLGPAGWAWAVGENLRNQIAYDTLNKELLGLPHQDFKRWLFAHPELLLPGSVISLGVEVFAPVALLHKRLGYVWAVLTLGMHWGILMLMGIAFLYPLTGIAFLCFFDIEKPVEWVLRRLGLEGEPYIPRPQFDRRAV